MDLSKKERFLIATENGNRSIFVDIWGYLRAHKKWWLLPILLMATILGVLIAAAGSTAAPFIYTLF